MASLSFDKGVWDDYHVVCLKLRGTSSWSASEDAPPLSCTYNRCGHSPIQVRKIHLLISSLHSSRIEDLPMESQGIPAAKEPSPATSKSIISTSEISSFELPSPLSTPQPSESEETVEKVDTPKSPLPSVLFTPSVKVDGKCKSWRNLKSDSE